MLCLIFHKRECPPVSISAQEIYEPVTITPDWETNNRCVLTAKLADTKHIKEVTLTVTALKLENMREEQEFPVII
jgi:hypothetical protein